MPTNGVRVLIVDNDERLLVSIRAASAKYYPNTIQVPGGTVEETEDSKDAAVRETFEETGLVLDRDALIPLCSLPGVRNGDNETPYIRFSYLYRWPLAEAPNAELLEPDKNTPWIMQPLKILMNEKGTIVPGLIPGLIEALNAYRSMRSNVMK